LRNSAGMKPRKPVRRFFVCKHEGAFADGKRGQARGDTRRPVGVGVFEGGIPGALSRRNKRDEAAVCARRQAGKQTREADGAGGSAPVHTVYGG